MKRPVPTNESERNASVERSLLLDTPFEERFDRLTRIAKRVFQTPICMVTILHGERQWFKSVVGHSFYETPRVESFCQYTITDSKPFVISGASKDPRFFDLPVVFDFGIEFYAGVPLHHSDGHRVGTLCILDTEEREFDLDDEAALVDLGLCIEAEMKLSRWSRVEQELITKCEALERRESLDPTTMCWNEKALENLFASAQEKHVVPGTVQSLSALLIRVEGTLEVNERYGHDIGDQLLRAVATRLRRLYSNFSFSTVLGRLQGPRFLMLFEYTGDSEMEDLCEEILASVCERRFRHPNGSHNIEVSGVLGIDIGTVKTLRDLLSKLTRGSSDTDGGTSLVVL